ncbi:MAG: serine hydrolase [Lacunisphaera sp.]|nr:serine hydrolase [Lacunisphaera sp.]
MKLPRLPLSALLFVCILAPAAFAAAAATPESLGFSSERLGRLDALIQDHIDHQQLAGAVMFVARDGQTAHLKAYGLQDKASGQPMATDAIFRIASMSKAVTTIAALMLYEEGRFMLNDPVAKYIPAFANSVVAMPPPADAPAGTKYVTVPAKRPISIRDLLRHTAGLTYGDGLAVDDYKKANVYYWYFANHDETIGEAVDRLAQLPLHGQPGEVWQYGFSTDVLGRLVEVVSGMPLDRFMAERIFQPLKMPDTSFFLPAGKESRLATVYALGKDGLTRGDQGDYVTGPRKCFAGGAGLLSTAQDYGRLLQMLVNEGELDGVRLLSPLTVRLMHANHTGEKYAWDAHAFGLGFWVNEDPGLYGELVGKGAYGWGSAYFPQYVVDPQEKIVALFMTQLRPAGGSDLNQKFKVLVYQALVKPKAEK